MYAVIDLETTGLWTGRHDRVCEIAIVRVDSNGGIEDEWCSLVNPGRDLGPQAIHGISAAEARLAPFFSDLAGHVVHRLSGRVIAAHNLVFDIGFLSSEFRRLGYDAPIAYHQGLCTMRLADQFLPFAGRSLLDCCDAAGIQIEHAHSALDDARAAAKLLGFYLTQQDDGSPLGYHTAADAQGWPSIPITDVVPVPRHSGVRRPQHFLVRIAERLPRVPDPQQADQYLALLDNVLLDRHISETEADTLIDLADTLDLSRADLLSLHCQYLKALAFEAVDDGVLTDAEVADLTTVAELLGLSKSDVVDSIEGAGRITEQPGATSTPRPRFRLAAGDTVVFTGQTIETRETWEQRARNAGLGVSRNVTKSTRIVAAADPDTLSGKARQARKYSIPIITIADFITKIAEMHRVR